MSVSRIGIVREAYSQWERRSPFTPQHVEKLVQRMGVEVVVQPSTKRVFKDIEYARAGAIVSEDLSSCNALFGVKKVPIEDLLPNKTYLFFSHVIKGQLENMELLDNILERNIRLIDYECITKGGMPGTSRLVAFGDYAGRAGMIDTVRGLGQQLLHNGISTPFLNVGSAYMYPSYQDAYTAVGNAGNAFCESGGSNIPRYDPLVFLFTGSGNVNRGARQVFQAMPHTMIKPSELIHAIHNPPSPILGCQVSVEDMVEHVEGKKVFSKEHYYQHPNSYRSVFFEKYAQHANILVNGAYWDARYPRVVSKRDIENFPDRRLHLIADISCDIDGGVEILNKPASIEDPFYYSDFKPAEDILLMGVDILPSELPREASQHFGDYLLPFVQGLADNQETSNLAPELQGACIADAGWLRNKFKYIQKMRFERERAEHGNISSAETLEAKQLQVQGSCVFRLEGHLFDTGLINRMLDIVEAKAPHGRFHILECLVGPKQRSMTLLQVTMDKGRKELDSITAKMRQVIASEEFSKADASFEEMPREFCNGRYDATITVDPKPGFEKDEAANSDRQLLNSGFTAAPSLQRVLVLGAGMVAKPCVEYLSRDASRLVLVASSAQQELDTLMRQLSRSNVQPCLVDARASSELTTLIGTCDLVISLLPWQMHTEIAKKCIETKTKLVTASYVSPEMRQLNEAAKEAGISVLCEMGLDPGMDHLSAKMVIDEIHDAGEKVWSFTSVCGGLPAPEAANNPFGYKFSWSPRGVLSAMQNSSKFLKDGKVINVDGKDLLSCAEPFRMHMMPSLCMEQLPNRDSTIYAGIYGIPEAQTCFRGTLRYEGFSATMLEFVKSGFLETNKTFEHCRSEFKMNTPAGHAAVDAMDWLLDDYYTEEFGKGPAIDQLCQVLQDKLALGPNERDMCAMQHTFNGNHHISTMMALGDTTGTSMAKTVGVTAAIGAELVLDKSQEVSRATGILMPTEKFIYKPALELLAKEGLHFKVYESSKA